MSRKATIVRRESPADLPQIASLLDRTFGSQPFDVRRALWDWRNRHNPAHNGTIPGFLVAVRDDVIVGVHGLLPLRVALNGREVIASCSCDLAVDPGARAVGLKLKLAALDPAISPLHISTSANKPANAMTLGLGGREIPAARRKFIRILRLEGLVRHRVSQRAGSLAGAVGAGAAMPLDAALRIGRLLRRPRPPAGTRIEPVNTFGARFAGLHALLAGQARGLIIRDAEYLEWRYARYPFPGLQAWGLFRGETALGLVVVHIAVDEDGLLFGALLDLIADPALGGAQESLLRTASAHAAAHGAHYITAIATLPSLERVLRRHGFIVRTLEYSPATWRVTDGTDGAGVSDADWYLSLGDGDGSFFLPDH